MDRSLATSSLGLSFGEWTSQKSPRDLQLGEPVEAGLVGEAVETAREAPGELLPSTRLLGLIIILVKMMATKMISTKMMILMMDYDENIDEDVDKDVD